MVDYIGSLICAIITLGMALLQLSITFGEYVLGGENKVLPKKMRLISCMFFLIFIFVGMAYLQWGNILDIGFNSMLVKIIIIVNTMFLAYAIIGNGMLTKSKKEKYVMTPFSVIQFIWSLVAFFIH